MKFFDLPEIERCVSLPDAVPLMREALIAHSRGQCDTPMPMHLEIPAENAEVHMKSSYRRGGPYFALKMAATFPRGSDGMMLLCSAATGEPLAYFADRGYLTDLRTAAAAAMVTRELGRTDQSLGILGTGIQARLQARVHAGILDLKEIWLWGRTPAHAEACRAELAERLHIDVHVARTPAEVARNTRLIVTATASRSPLLYLRDLARGAHLHAVGADARGKQELDPGIARSAMLILADSKHQCQELGELQHAPERIPITPEIGEFCENPKRCPPGITLADFTGLGVEDLYIAQYCYERLA